MHRLTDRQQEIYDLICEYIARHGAPPSWRELTKVLDIASPNGLTCHLDAMKKKGLIDSDTSAGIWPTGMRAALCDMARDWIETNKRFPNGEQ